MSHIMLHTPILGFALAVLAGIGLGFWLTQGHPLKDKLMVAGLIGVTVPFWLEAARLALKGAL
jgi:hypothetical protein